MALSKDYIRQVGHNFHKHTAQFQALHPQPLCACDDCWADLELTNLEGIAYAQARHWQAVVENARYMLDHWKKWGNSIAKEIDAVAECADTAHKTDKEQERDTMMLLQKELNDVHNRDA